MYNVYVLFSTFDKKLYIGFTEDVSRRFNEHCLGKVASTKHRRPLELIYYETYINRAEAERREKFLKGGKGRQALKEQLSVTLLNLGYKHLS